MCSPGTTAASGTLCKNSEKRVKFYAAAEQRQISLSGGCLKICGTDLGIGTGASPPWKKGLTQL